jgi:alpha-glucosidase
MYYGEELGMENNDPTRREDVKDPLGQAGWPDNKGRDGERTPMQWDDTLNAGFTSGTPWLPVPPSYKTHNVKSELNDPDSVLNFYKKLIEIRRQNKALLDGEYVPLNQNDPNVLAYLRRLKGQESVLIVLNMSDHEQQVNLNLSEANVHANRKDALLTSQIPSPSTNPNDPIMMGPFSVYIGRLSGASK